MCCWVLLWIFLASMSSTGGNNGTVENETANRPELVYEWKYDPRYSQMPQTHEMRRAEKRQEVSPKKEAGSDGGLIYDWKYDPRYYEQAKRFRETGN